MNAGLRSPERPASPSARSTYQAGGPGRSAAPPAGKQQRPLQTARVTRQPTVAGGLAAEAQIVATVGIEAAALHQALEHLGAMLRPEAEARRPVPCRRSAQNRRRMPRSSSLTNCGGFIERVRRSTTPRRRPETCPRRSRCRNGAGRPSIQHVEQLLAGARRSRLLLGDGDRRAAQILDPRQHAGAHRSGWRAPRRRVQHGGNVPAMAARAGRRRVLTRILRVLLARRRRAGDCHLQLCAHGNTRQRKVGLRPQYPARD